MYDNEYEWDILLFLRILKYLHTSDADMVNAIIRDYPEVDEEDPDMIMYDLLWAFLMKNRKKQMMSFTPCALATRALTVYTSWAAKMEVSFHRSLECGRKRSRIYFCFMSLAHPTLSSMLPIILPETASRSTLHFHRIAMSRFSS